MCNVKINIFFLHTKKLNNPKVEITLGQTSQFKLGKVIGGIGTVYQNTTGYNVCAHTDTHIRKLCNRTVISVLM